MLGDLNSTYQFSGRKERLESLACTRPLAVMVIIRPVKKLNLEENVSIALVSKDIFTIYGVI